MLFVNRQNPTGMKHLDFAFSLSTYSLPTLARREDPPLLVPTATHVKKSIGVRLQPHDVGIDNSGITSGTSTSGKRPESQPKLQDFSVFAHSKSMGSAMLWSPIELSPELGGRESSLSPLMPSGLSSSWGCGCDVGRRAASFIFSSHRAMLWYLPPSTSTLPCSMHLPRSEPV